MSFTTSHTPAVFIPSTLGLPTSFLTTRILRRASMTVCSHADQQWYKTLTRTPTAMLQLDEKALVATGMSLLWLPKNPRAAPIYAYKDKAYNLMNALDPEVGGEMVTQLLPEGEIPWVEQIQDNFLHPTPESLNTYIAIPTGARPLVSTSSEVGKSPTREGVILL
ncbi:hypothetical protein HanRHA438_Chr05g0239511 [Helianthus annuus]|nr:hypothetical protein HanRHA438_Chr05g0239511 [Helianthus annuus]